MCFPDFLSGLLERLRTPSGQHNCHIGAVALPAASRQLQRHCPTNAGASTCYEGHAQLPSFRRSRRALQGCIDESTGYRLGPLRGGSWRRELDVRV